MSLVHSLYLLCKMCILYSSKTYVIKNYTRFLTLKRTEHARRVFKLYTSGHPQLTSPFPFQEPLLNFIQFFISAIDKQSPQLVKLLKDKYKKSLERDPCFNEVTYFWIVTYSYLDLAISVFC